jgi:hypothetical protein
MTTSDRERAAVSLRRAIQVTAREAFGAGVVERPIPGFSLPHRDVEPLAGVRAAALARDVAVRCVREYALAARADGRSWDEVAGALGVERGEGSVSGGERVYLHLIEDRPLYADDPDLSWAQRAAATHWRCGSCNQYVTDQGPFEASPEGNEQGHAAGCARHAAEMATYRGSATTDSDPDESTP